MLSCALLAVAQAADSCYMEQGHSYDSKLNLTTLRKCNDTKSDRVCIVGSGSSAVHMSWLLKRRGYINTVMYEKEDRIGGKIWTHQPQPGDVVRELGTAFLSPDYYEVRGLLSRFKQEEVPVSVSKEIQTHSNHTAPGIPISQWYDDQVAKVTGTTDKDANMRNISIALNRYFGIHAEIFGKYDGRMPPEPKDATALQRIDCSIDEFLVQESLQILHPLFYQFFVMQGMGLLSMPAYYGE